MHKTNRKTVQQTKNLSTHSESAVEGPYVDVAYIYDGSLEGLLTAVFTAYELHENPPDIAVGNLLQPRFSQYLRTIETDANKASRVKAGIIKACGYDTFKAVMAVAMACDPTAPKEVLKFVRFAMKQGKGALYNLAGSDTSAFLQIRKSVLNECERMNQFVRFRELEGGIFFSKINPRDNVVPLIMGHFAARFNTQPFIIYDENHHIAGVYEGRDWYLVPTDDTILERIPDEAAHEWEYEDAWRRFYKALTIDARYHPELRRQHMPIRLWKNLTEMQTVMPSLARRSLLDE